MTENKSKRDELADHYYDDVNDMEKPGMWDRRLNWIIEDFKAGFDSALEHATAAELARHPLVKELIETLQEISNQDYRGNAPFGLFAAKKSLEPFMQAKDEV